ncbi:MAG: PH domain-containing protein [Candidatus Bathyarchaeia archaeon]
MNEKQDIPKEVVIAPNEKVLMILKRHYVSYVTVATIGLIVIWFITASITLALPPEYGLIKFPMLVFVFLVLPVLVYGLGYIYVRGHRYIITNERIIMFRKFIGILMRTVTHDKITDLIVNQGPLARWLNYGSITPLSPRD